MKYRVAIVSAKDRTRCILQTTQLFDSEEDANRTRDAATSYFAAHPMIGIDDDGHADDVYDMLRGGTVLAVTFVESESEPGRIPAP